MRAFSTAKRQRHASFITQKRSFCASSALTINYQFYFLLLARLQIFARMRNTIIVTIVLFAAVVGASVYYFADLDREKVGTAGVLSFLPKDTFLIAGFRNDAATDNTFRDFDIFKAILGREHAESFQRFKGKFLRHPRIQTYVDGVEIYLSIHPVGERSEPLLSIPTAGKIRQEKPEKLFRQLAEGFTVTSKDTLNVPIFRFGEDSTGTHFHVALYRDVFFVSPSEALLAKVVDEKTTRIDAAQIEHFAEHRSRNSPLSVSFSHGQLSEIANHLMHGKYGKTVSLFAGLGGRSVWNLYYKNDVLILSGESEIDRKGENYLELFSHQSKTPQNLYSFFPESTASYLSFSISDADRFRADLDALFAKRGELDRIKTGLAEAGERDAHSFERDLRPFFGNEFALVEQANRTELAFIALSDTTSFFRNISGFATEDRDSIFRFDRSGLLYAQFGEPLKPFVRPYFVRLGGMIVAAAHKNTLRQYRRDWTHGDLLVGTLGFGNFERIQSNEANVTYFIRTKSATDIIAAALKPGFRNAFRDGQNFGYGDFYAWSAQISGNNGHFLSGIYGIYKDRQHYFGGTPEWTYALAHRPITRPWVFEHSDTSRFILIQEQDHTVHGIHPSGRKMWSAVFSGAVVGDIQQLPDRSIVLVTDRKRLYRFETNGKPIKGFSLALPHKPSHSPTIAHIGGEDLIFIPAGKHLLAYTMGGRPADGWANKALDGNILFDVKTTDDGVFAATENGRFYQFGAQGQPIKAETVKSRFRNPVLLSRSGGGRPVLQTVDTAGVLFTVDFDRPPFGRKWADWSENSIVSFGNVGRTTSPEMAVLNGRRLSVYSLADSVEVFGHTFTQEITDRPQFFRDAGDNPSVGLALRGNGQIYLIDERGSVRTGFPIEALPLFHYGKIDYSGTDHLLCVRRDRKMYALTCFVALTN